jgi:hypothetical protein
MYYYIEYAIIQKKNDKIMVKEAYILSNRFYILLSCEINI